MAYADPRLVIVTGLSGAGKTQAIRSLEDLGFFCIDNLPPYLLPRLVELFRLGRDIPQFHQVAVVMDIRGGRFFEGLSESLRNLDDMGLHYEILFLEAIDQTLVRRFKETRRRHPLSAGGSILEDIAEERRRLGEVRGRATTVIDTSELNAHQLKDRVSVLYGQADPGLAISVLSFGFKYGVPLDADLVMDVRFLPNPHYVESLRPFTGHEKQVADYVMDSPLTNMFLEKFRDLLEFLIPYYIQEGKAHLVLAIGCTGGKHRSVVLANRLGKDLALKNYRVNVSHRDVLRG